MDVIGLIDEIYDCAQDRAQWENVFQSLHDAFGCAKTQIVSQDVRTRDVGVTAPIGGDQSEVDKYLRKWRSIDYFPEALRIQGMKQIGSTAPVWMTPIFKEADYERSAVYNEFFWHLGMRHNLTLPLGLGWEISGINLWREGSDFADEQLGAASILSAHIGRALRLSDQMAFISPVLSRTDPSKPLLLVDQRLELLERNKAAIAVLNQNAPIRMNGPYIHFSEEGIHSKVTAALYADPPPLTRIPLDKGTVISIIPAKIKRIAGGRLLKRYYYIELNTAPAATPPLSAIVQSLLTPTEQAIVESMVNGLSLEKIAEERKTKINTVRWHIRQIYGKLGVSNQRELLLKLLSPTKDNDRERT